MLTIAGGIILGVIGVVVLYLVALVALDIMLCIFNNLPKKEKKDDTKKT